MFPEWHHAVPESAYFKVPETLKTFSMYSISRFVYVLDWLGTRLSPDLAISALVCVEFAFHLLSSVMTTLKKVQTATTKGH